MQAGVGVGCCKAEKALFLGMKMSHLSVVVTVTQLYVLLKAYIKECEFHFRSIVLH